MSYKVVWQELCFVHNRTLEDKKSPSIPLSTKRLPYFLKKNIGLGQFFVYFKLSAQFRKPMTHSTNKYHEKSVVDVLLGSNCCHRCSESSAIPLSYSGTLEVALFKWCNKCPVNFRNRLAFTCSIRIIALDRHVNCWNFSFNLLWYVQCG